MPETTNPSLNSVAETSLITLYIRATESQRPDALIKLDTRFERADNGQVEWYDLDLPDVIDLRRELIGGEGRGSGTQRTLKITPGGGGAYDAHCRSK